VARAPPPAGRVMDALSLLLLLLAGGPCLFIDQAEGGTSLAVARERAVELPTELPEGAWLCPARTAPPPHRPPRPRSPLPLGELRLTDLRD
jgi:hypothetical protein